MERYSNDKARQVMTNSAKRTRPVRIAYVTTGEFPDSDAWSGTIQHIHDALLAAGAELFPIHSLKKHRTFLQKLKKSGYQLTGKRYQPTRDPNVLAHYAQQVARLLDTIPHDVVLSPGGTPIAYLESQAPIVCYTDATYAGVVDYYKHYSNLCQETLDHGHGMENRMLQNASLVIYASDWAADSALDHYNADPDKIKVVPFGANLATPPSSSDIDAAIEDKIFERCNLLFVGVDWKRKGGDLAVAVTEALNLRGCHAHLHVVGCIPEGDVPDCVTVHGFLNKRNTKELLQLQQLFLSSHFFILPSQAECYGVVFAEASAYGLPSIALRTGGVPTVIQTGKNGWTLSVDDTVQEWCDILQPVFTNRQACKTIARESRLDYEQRLNWTVAGRTLMSLIKSVLQD